MREILDVLRNNAARHGRDPVSIGLRTIGEHWAELTVSNNGPGFTSDEHTAFERRSTNTDGHGVRVSLTRSAGNLLWEKASGETRQKVSICR